MIDLGSYRGQMLLTNQLLSTLVISLESHLPLGMFRYLTPLDCYVGSLVSGRNPGPMLRVNENLTWIEDSVSPG